MTEDKYRKDVRLAEKAREFLDNEAVKEVRNYLDRTYTDKWKSSGDAEGREACWYMIKALDHVFLHMANTVQNGKIAQKYIDEAILAQRRVA